jgi:GST-like protein
MESCAILQYLGERFPSELSPLDERRWDVLQWLTWQAANVGPVFGNKLSYTRYMDGVPAAQKSHPLERFGTEASRLMRVLNRRLEGREFVCDTFTIADIALYPWVRAWKWAKVDIMDQPNILAWLSSVRARPGVGRGLAYGVPDGEVDQWSEARKAQYKKGGSSIAANERIAGDLD